MTGEEIRERIIESRPPSQVRTTSKAMPRSTAAASIRAPLPSRCVARRRSRFRVVLR